MNQQGVDDITINKANNLKLTITIPLYDLVVNEEYGEKISYIDIETKVRQIIADKKLPKNNIVLYSIQANNNITKIQSYREFKTSTVVVVQFSDGYKVIKERINLLNQDFNRIQKFFKNDFPILPCYSHTPLVVKGSYLSKDRKSLFDPVVDIAIFTSSPLVKFKRQDLRNKQVDLFIQKTQTVSTKFQQINYIAQLNRIKKQLLKNQDIIEIAIHQGTKQNLITQMQNKKRILHLICNVEVIDNVVYFCLQDNVNIGLQKNSNVQQMFSKINQLTRPDLMILIGHKVSFAAEIINKAGFTSIVFIQSSNYNEDTRAHVFIQKFYFFLSKGGSVKQSFNRARKQAKQIKSYEQYNCCCLHPHEQKCLWLKQVCEFGVQACHRVYHNQYPFCSCKTFTDFKKNTPLCPFGKNNLRLTNLVYEDQVFFEGKTFYCETVCCCIDPSQKDKLHKQYQKIGIYSYQQKQTYVFKATQGVIITQFIIKMPRQRNYDFQPLIGINKNMYELIIRIIDQNFALNFFGPKRSGRSSLLRQAIRYLLDRNFCKYNKVECNFTNVQNLSDCQYIIKQAMGVSKIPDLKEAFQQFSQQKTIFIFQNCDYIDSHFCTKFGRLISLINQTFSGLQLIAVSQKKLAIENFGQRIWEIPTLTPAESADIFLRRTQKMNSTSYYNLNKLKDLFDQFSGKLPLYFQKVDSIRRQYQNLNKNSLEKIIMNNTISNLSNKTDIPQVFIQKMNSLKNILKNDDNKIYTFLLFLSQFQEGLTQLDFRIISKLKGLKKKQQTKEKQVKQQDKQKQIKQQNKEKGFCNMQINWLWLINIINSKQDKDKQYLDSLKEFIDVIENKGYYYKTIKVNEYSRVYFQTYQKQQALVQMRLKSLRYITVYTITMIRYICQNYHYHESVYEFSKISDTGIFEIKKAEGYKNFFDKQGRFPFIVDIQNIQQALIELDNICCTKIGQQKVQIKSISKLILQQKDNIMSTYRFNFQSVKVLSQQNQYIFEHYYYTLLINIATISITITSQINALFIEYCLQKSLESSKNLLKRKKTYAMLIIKLFITKLGVNIKQTENKLKLYDEFEQKINTIIQETWQKQSLIHLIWKSQKIFIKLYIYLFLELDDKNPNLVLNLLRQLAITVEQLQTLKIKGFQSRKLKARLGIFQSQYVLKYTNNYYLKYFPKFKQLMIIGSQQYNHCQLKIFKSKGSYFQKKHLFVKLNLNDIQCQMKNINNQINDYHQLKLQYDKLSAIITNQKQFKISQKKILKQYQKIGQDLKLAMSQKTNIVMAYLKSSPLQELNKNNNRNMLRSFSKFKSQIESLFDKSKKHVMAIFRLLTFKNFENVLSHGCLLLSLTIDSQIKNKKIYMVFQDEILPTKDFRLIQDVKELFYKSQLGIILICGKNSQKLCEQIQNFKPSECPILIAIDTLAIEDFIEKDNLMSINKHLQRVVLEKSIEYFIRNFSDQLINTSIPKQQFNFQIKTINKIAYSKTRKYISNKYDTLNKYDQLRDILNPKITKTLKVFDINFEPGQYTNISFNNRAQHNIEDSYDNVGRLSTIINISKFLTNQTISEKNLFDNPNYNFQTMNYLNIYGASGIGKRTIMIEVAFPFLARKIFQDGIYLIDCEHVYKNFRGNIMQYLQQQLNILLQKLNDFANKNSVISLLLFLDNFSQIQQSANQQFFKLIEQIKVKLVITTIRQYHKDKIFNTNLVKLQLKQFEEYQARILLYSNIDINYYSKYGQIEEIQQKLNQTYNRSYIPGQMKNDIDNFSQKYEGHIRKKQNDKQQIEPLDQIYNRSMYLNSSGIGIGQSNMGINSDLFNSNINFAVKRITKIKLIGKKVVITPTSSVETDPNRIRKDSDISNTTEQTINK